MSTDDTAYMTPLERECMAENRSRLTLALLIALTQSIELGRKTK